LDRFIPSSVLIPLTIIFFDILLSSVQVNSFYELMSMTNMPEISVVLAKTNASSKNILNCTGISYPKAVFKSSESHLKVIFRHL
jgi:hypothetical protein